MEEWKEVTEYPGYLVSSLGRVKGRRWKNILKTSPDLEGYPRVSLHKDGRQYRRGVHQLVAAAFIENSGHKPHIDHINRDKADNRVCNLRWATAKENEDNKPRGICGEKYITEQRRKTGWAVYYRVTIGNRPLFKTLEEAIQARDTILNI